MGFKVRFVEKYCLNLLDEFVLWGASMVPWEGKLLLVGGSTPKHGKLATIFEYHPIFGFRLLPTTLKVPRYYVTKSSGFQFFGFLENCL